MKKGQTLLPGGPLQAFYRFADDVDIDLLLGSAVRGQQCIITKNVENSWDPLGLMREQVESFPGE
jgi:hypothetical protein